MCGDVNSAFRAKRICLHYILAPVLCLVGPAKGDSKMQPDLPWNVAGIPPEAREAARAAARREGLSVGEWLTRNILRSLTETAETGVWDRQDAPGFTAPD